jgi:hypothetical protein
MAQGRGLLKTVWAVFVAVVKVLTVTIAACVAGGIAGCMMNDEVGGVIHAMMVAPAIIAYVMIETFRGRGRSSHIWYWAIIGIAIVVFVVLDRPAKASGVYLGRLSDTIELIAGGVGAYLWLIFLAYCRAASEWLVRIGVLRWVRRAVAVLAICATSLLVGALLWFVWMWNGTPVVAMDYLAKFNEMRKPANYKAEDDGAPLFLKACSMMGDADVPEFERVEAMKDSDGTEWERRTTATWPGEMNDADVGKLRAWLAGKEKAFNMVSDALGKRCFWLKRTSKDGSIAQMETDYQKQALRLVEGLVLRGKLRAWEGDIDAGLSDIALAGAIGRCFSESMDSWEWWGAIRTARICSDSLREILSRTKVGPAHLALAADIIHRGGGQVPPIASLAQVEKMVLRDAVQRHFTDNGRGGGRIILRGMVEPLASMMCLDDGRGRKLSTGDKLVGILLSAVVGWNAEGRKATVARSDRMLSNVVDMSRSEPLLADSNGGRGIWQHPFFDFIYLMSDVPSARSMLDTWYRFRNNILCTEGVVGILRYRADAGTLPDGWEDVVRKGYLTSVPIDAYSGKAVVYKKTGQRFTVYSVGDDGCDDGGDRYKDRIYWPVE